MGMKRLDAINGASSELLNFNPFLGQLLLGHRIVTRAKEQWEGNGPPTLTDLVFIRLLL